MNRFPLSIFILFTICLLIRCSQVEQSNGCPDCMSPAISIAMVDSIGTRLNGFTILFINNKQDTIKINDQHLSIDSTYSLYGKSGEYTIIITSSSYVPIVLQNIITTENRCGINNTRNLTVKPTRAALLKSKVEPYTITGDFVTPGCGS